MRVFAEALNHGHGAKLGPTAAEVSAGMCSKKFNREHGRVRENKMTMAASSTFTMPPQTRLRCCAFAGLWRKRRNRLSAEPNTVPDPRIPVRYRSYPVPTCGRLPAKKTRKAISPKVHEALHHCHKAKSFLYLHHSAVHCKAMVTTLPAFADEAWVVWRPH